MPYGWYRALREFQPRSWALGGALLIGLIPESISMYAYFMNETLLDARHDGVLVILDAGSDVRPLSGRELATGAGLLDDDWIAGHLEHDRDLPVLVEQARQQSAVDPFRDVDLLERVVWICSESGRDSGPDQHRRGGQYRQESPRHSSPPG